MKAANPLRATTRSSTQKQTRAPIGARIRWLPAGGQAATLLKATPALSGRNRRSRGSTFLVDPVNCRAVLGSAETNFGNILHAPVVQDFAGFRPLPQRPRSGASLRLCHPHTVAGVPSQPSTRRSMSSLGLVRFNREEVLSGCVAEVFITVQSWSIMVGHGRSARRASSAAP